MNRPFLNFDSSEALLFDGLAAVCWFINMRSDVTNARVANISPGQLYTFVITQDDAGSHVFTWPAICINAMMVDPAPNAITVQNFVGQTGGTLLANLPGTWTEVTP
jgi:hypothetical protein